MKRFLLILLCFIAMNSYANKQTEKTKDTSNGYPESWYRPVAPFQIADHTWYIGTEGLSTVLIKTSAGAVLIDTGMPDTAKNLIAQMNKVGVKPSDVKWILHSHAHLDHIGSVAEVRLATGAKIATNAESAVLMERGGKDDIHFGDKAPFPAAKSDRFLMDGESISVGNIKLTVHFTPAHTPGSMSWTWTDQRDGKPLRIAYADSLAAPGYQLLNNPRYPRIMEDFRHGIAVVRSLPCDLLLTPHPEASGWTPENAKDPHPNPMTCKAYAAKVQKRLYEQLRKK